MQTDKNIAIAKLNEYVQAGINKAQEGMNALAHEYGLRQDIMVKPSMVDVKIADGRFLPVITTSHMAKSYELTGHARGQFLARAGIPSDYADTLIANGLGDLFRDSVRQLMPKISKEGMLVRTVGHKVKGWMSSSYRRLDSTPLFETFVKEAMRSGLVPYQGSVTDTRAFLSFIEPTITEVKIGNGVDYVVRGIQCRNSDYGNGKYRIDLFILRLRCNNGATGMDLFSKVHLGARFDFGDEEVVTLSNKTIELDTQTVQSALRDTIGQKVLPGHFKALTSAIETHGAGEVHIDAAIANLKKKGVKAAVVEQVRTLWETDLPVEAVPQDKNAWRFSNILSMLANKAEGGDEAADLRDVAFNVLIPKKAA